MAYITCSTFVSRASCHYTSPYSFYATHPITKPPPVFLRSCICTFQQPIAPVLHKRKGSAPEMCKYLFTYLLDLYTTLPPERNPRWEVIQTVSVYPVLHKQPLPSPHSAVDKGSCNTLVLSPVSFSVRSYDIHACHDMLPRQQHDADSPGRSIKDGLQGPMSQMHYLKMRSHQKYNSLKLWI